MDITYRKITTDDYPLLREMLYLAVFVPEGAKPYPRSIIDLPAIKKYISNWDTSVDFGYIILSNDEPIGSIWAKLLSEENKGYGFVDEDTPELCMALKEKYRNQGIGTRMMPVFFQLARQMEYSSISLSVDKLNPAVRLYLRSGFLTLHEADQDYTMRIQL